MRTRDMVDKKNEQTYQRYINKYPNVLKGYELNMSRKTSFTRNVYLQYVMWFLDYIAEKKQITITDGSELNIIKPMDIDEYMATIRYHEDGNEKSVTYRGAQLAAINGFFSFLYRNEIIKSNPCKMVEPPRDNKEHEIVVIEQEDIDKMLYNIENGIGTYKSQAQLNKWVKRDKLIVVLGITTGLRVSAMVGIDLDDINFEEKYIRIVEKGNIEKKIYIGKKTIELMRDWIVRRAVLVKSGENALFICNGGKRMTVRTMENIIKNASGGKYTPHKMRATCATRLYEATGDIYRVQQQLGHRSIKNTQRYAKVGEKQKMESANILDAMF